MNYHNEHLTRQLDIVPIEILGTPITVIGAGAIGGWTTLALAKMGFSNITVFDDDRVDLVNLNSQFFRKADALQQRYKVAALKEMVQEFTDVVIQPHGTRYEKGIFPGIVIAAVDSMKVRELIWYQHAERSPFTKAIIDPRMGAESALLYCMNPMDDKDCREYPKSLYSDDSAIQERCTAKATIYTANLLSGLVVKAVKDVLTRPDYLRVCQWDIAQNEQICFPRAKS
jgi:molybdopterin/thiamine biosynthesis adenylyltransferase